MLYYIVHTDNIYVSDFVYRWLNLNNNTYKVYYNTFWITVIRSNILNITEDWELIVIKK